MGVIVLVLSLKGYLRVVGVVCILISHGVIRRGMFLNVTLFYKLRKSRSVLLKKGLIYYLPLFIFFWLLLCVSKMSFPPLLSFISEVILFSVVFLFRGFYIIFIGALIFRVGLYKMYLYRVVRHGIRGLNLQEVRNRLQERISLFFHSVFSFISIFFLKNIF